MSSMRDAPRMGMVALAGLALITLGLGVRVAIRERPAADLSETKMSAVVATRTSATLPVPVPAVSPPPPTPAAPPPSPAPVAPLAAAPAAPVDARSRSLADCCGTTPASLGPLFGALVIGELSASMADAVLDENGPAFLHHDRTGLTIELSVATGQYGMYLDGVRIVIGDHAACAQLGQRLEAAWGSTGTWKSSDRRRAARLYWTGTKATSTCQLSFWRVPTTNPAHCLRDESPVQEYEIDTEKKCLRAARATGCRLDREQPQRPVGWCSVDDTHHTFWKSDEPGSRRSCTNEERDQLGFYALTPCEN